MNQPHLTTDSIANPSLLSLCLRISADRLDLMLYNPYEDQSLIHRSISFSEDPQFKSMTRMRALENYIYDNPLLLCGEFSNTDIIIDTPDIALFPSAIENPQSLIHNILPQVENDTPTLLLPFSPLEVNMVVAPETSLLNFLQRTFAGARLTHPLMPLMTYAKSKLQGAGRKAFINLHRDSLELIVMSSTRLSIATRLSYRTIDDASFYILSALSQAECDADEIFITGDNSDKSALTESLRRFHPYVMPMIFPSQMHRAGAPSGVIPFDLLILPLTV